jgi:hypothetical protein
MRRELARTDGKRDRVFTSHARRELPKPRKGPAPGDYDPRIPQHIHESRFAKFADWIDHSKADVPPPDAYQQIRMSPGKGITIAKATRDAIDGDKFPGPGTYDVLHGSLSKKSKNVRTIQATE